MDKAQAIHNFWSSFGWKAYDDSTVPASDFEPTMPRITYEVAISELNYPITITASLWSRSFSWEDISKKAEEIYEYIGMGGTLIPYDGGAIWLTRSAPFAQRLADDDDTIRRIMLTVNAEFLSA